MSGARRSVRMSDTMEPQFRPAPPALAGKTLPGSRFALGGGTIL